MPAPEIRQSAAEQVRGVDRSARTVDLIASTFDLDSYGTRIDPAGWDLEPFKKNPVICLQHDSHGFSGSNGLPVAKAIPETVRVVNGELVMRIQFPAEGTFPLADQVFSLIADGFLRGVSVGFDPQEWENVEELHEGEKRVVQVYRQQRLVETSLVTIPSNDKALIQSRSKKMNVDAEAVQERTAALDKLVAEAAPEDELAKFTRDHLLKCVNYFADKQPCNREATRFLEKFFKARGETQPAEEIAAWKRMHELQDADTAPPAPTPAVEPPKEELAPAPAAEPEKDPPLPPAPQAPEAPVPERKASVQLTAAVLQQLPKLIAETAGRAAVEALQRGVPRKDVGKTVAAAVDALKTALRNS